MWNWDHSVQGCAEPIHDQRQPNHKMIPMDRATPMGQMMMEMQR
jgi:hypothetical protein